MLNPNLKLNPKVLDADVEQLPIRKGFGEGLVKAAEQDKAVVGLCADLTESTHMLAFKQKFPERFIEIGIAEQNLAGVASGMAAMGKIPFITSYAMFSPGRNWEQIRTTIAYNNRPVKIAGSHAGVSVGPDGGTHQAIEDMAITRVMPRMIVLSPCDAIEARKATLAAAKTDTPVYIRLAREKTPIITTEETPFEIGKAAMYFDARLGDASAGQGAPLKPAKASDKAAQAQKLDLAIIATGALVRRALVVADRLAREGVRIAVMNLATIKPLDVDTIVRLAQDAGALVTVEEHQIAGGMGSAVAECLAAHNPVPIEFVGVRDQFGQSGAPEELIKLYGMDEQAIYDAATRVRLRKK